MPLHLPSMDTRNALLCAAVPSIGAFVGSTMAIKDQELVLLLLSGSFLVPMLKKHDIKALTAKTRGCMSAECWDFQASLLLQSHSLTPSTRFPLIGREFIWELC
ncbi:hypothetical protein niasHT_007634 [Heterodera trifolii]|uniref:Uncharacterized protein n=1 Tax=Heterodera trifolii TaxID=157864 RepID=A0ABD2LPR1_9BILA